MTSRSHYDGAYRRSTKVEFRNTIGGDLGALLAGYDRVCRVLNAATREEELAQRLREHPQQEAPKGAAAEAKGEGHAIGDGGPTLPSLDLSGIVVPRTHARALVCALTGELPQQEALKGAGAGVSLTRLTLDGCLLGDGGIAEV